jgi:hypothetical protein
MADSLTPGTPTITQVAEDIASRRCQEAVNQFETTYAELLDPIRGSRLSYKASIRRDGELSIVFSKPKMHDVYLPVVASGIASHKKAEQLTPDELTSFLAAHLLQQEEYLAYAEQMPKRARRYKHALTVLSTGFVVSAVAFVAIVILQAVGIVQGSEDLWLICILLFVSAICSGIGFAVVGVTAIQNNIEFK